MNVRFENNMLSSHKSIKLATQSVAQTRILLRLAYYLPIAIHDEMAYNGTKK
jgi:hypothetical protein